MLNRRGRAAVVAGVVLALATTAVISTPVAGAPIPAGVGPSVMLPDTSAATAGPVVGNAAIAAAVPPVAQAGPARAAAAAAPPPPVTAPFLSDGFCSYAGISLKTLRPGLQTGCVDPVLGTYDPLDNCFWKSLVPQPPAGDPLYQGQSAAAGDLYSVTCETHNGMNVGNAAATVQYSTQLPINPALGLTLQQQAVATILNGLVTLVALAPIPVIGTEPPATGGVVGLPVWMWADIPPLAWDQQMVNKTVLGTKILLSFQGEQVDWDMGDGHHVICATPGTAYVNPTPPNFPYKLYTGLPGPSPDCSYLYKNVGTYGVTATTTWLAAFQVGSTGGTFVLSRTTKITLLTIGELQAVTE